MFKSFLKYFVRILPPGAPRFIYTKLLIAAPLRSLADTLLLSIVPSSIVIPEGRLYLDRTDPVISGALTLGVYEPFETDLFRKLLKPGMAVVDIGANIGYYTVLAARLVGPSGHVMAFEPERASYELLEKNVCENGFTNVILRNSAAADRAGNMVLHISATNKGNHTLVSVETKSDQFTSTEQVATERVDDSLAENNISRVDVVKIDVEGAEALAFSGMPKILAQTDLAVCMEFYPAALRRGGTDPKSLLALFVTHGFDILEMNEEHRTVRLITDSNIFADGFKKDEYSNILCLKGSFQGFRID